MRKLFKSLLCLSCLIAGNTYATDISVSSPAGTFLGKTTSGVQQFLGIPYAQAPVGELRWQPSRAQPSTSTPQDATEYGPICPQPDWPGNAGLPQSEDCLTLNILTPWVKGNAPLPVMFWIHGGSFKVGSNRWWVAEASRLAAKGVVVVSVNYRLGLLGRFSHPAITAEQGESHYANFGLMDQLTALRWVQENIAAFGGDQHNVTIFGYSAGAVSVNFLMAVPDAKGLFHRAISQSSAVSIPRTRQMLVNLPNRPSLEIEGISVAKKLGLGDTPSAPELRALSVAQLLSYPLPPGSMNPVVDGGFVREDLAQTYTRGDLNPGSYIVGVTSWEASLAKSMHAMPGSAYRKLLQSAHGFSAQQVDAVYGAERDPYAIGDELFADGFHGSSLWLAKQAQNAGLDTWLYWFSYLPTAAKSLPGVPHGGEVPYVFGNLQHRERIGKPVVTQADRVFSELVQNYWLHFARTGNPNFAGAPVWTPLNEKNHWMELGSNAGMISNVISERMSLWMNHYNKAKE